MFDTKPRPIKNLSVSKIEKILLCPRNFEYSYIYKIPQPSPWKLHAGQVVHEIIEKALREFAKSGAYPDWQTMDDQFEPTWERKRKEAEAKEDFMYWEDDPKDPVEELKPEYRGLVRVAREQALTTISPWMMEDGPAVEYKIDLELRSKVGPYPLIGYVDLLDASGLLIDWKTTDKKVSARASKTWLQFAAYSLWAWPLIGEENVRCEKIFLVRGKEGPYVERVPFTVGPKHREYFVNVAAKVWEMIHYGIYYPNDNSWLCSFCSYFKGCQGEVVKQKVKDESDES